MKNKIKILKLKVGDHGEVLAPTYENVIDKINELIKLTDERTKTRDEQLKNVHSEIRDYKRELMEYHNLTLKNKMVLEKFNEYLEQASTLYKSVAVEVLKIKKELKLDK